MKDSCLFVVALAVVMAVCPVLSATPMGTAFTYQGQLRDGGLPASGLYNIMFRLFDSPVTPTTIGGMSVGSVPVTNGLFTLNLDFGTTFAGQARWVEIQVQPVGGAGWTALTPRQELKPVPNSVYAATAGMAVAVTANGVTSSMLASDSASLNKVTAGLVNVNSTRVGIGMALPEEQLSITGALKVDQGNSNAGTSDIKFGAGATGEGIGSRRTGTGNVNGLDFFTNSTSRLNIANGGTVGVAGKLYVNQGDVTSDTAPSLVFGNSGSGEGIGSTRWAGDNVDGIDFYTGNSKKVSITSAGNVGIGTSNPAVKLEVMGNVRIQDNTALGIAFSGNGEAGADTGIGHPSDGVLTFWSNGGERMCLANNGSVGIGTLTPTSKLQIVGGDLVFEDQNDTARTIKNAYDIVLSKDSDNDSADAWFRIFTNGGAIEQLRIEDGDEAAIRGDGTFTSNGIDFAEAFKVVQGDLEPGDVVSLAIGHPEFCRRSTTAYDPALLGVISRKPSFLAGASFEQEAAASPELAQQRDQARANGDVQTERQLTAQLAEIARQASRPVAMLGRVPCKVVGAIQAGDYVTSSDTPGHAMRQVQAGPTLGIALEDAAGSGPARIMILVRPGWYGGAVAGPAQ